MKPFRFLFGVLRLALINGAVLVGFWAFTLCLVGNAYPDPAHPHRNLPARLMPDNSGLVYTVTWFVKESYHNIQIAGREYHLGYQRRRDNNTIASLAGAWVGKRVDSTWKEIKSVN